jgi:hypothetical protein
MYIDLKLYVTRSKIILMARVIARAWERVHLNRNLKLLQEKG